MTRDGARTYACTSAARWLPRVLGASVLAAGTLSALRIHPGVPGATGFRLLLIGAAAFGALWIVRRGGELRQRVWVDSEGVALESGGQRVGPAFERIEALRFEAPFGPSRSWAPAAVVVERGGLEWRLSGFLVGGGELIDEILEHGGREDLVAWAEAHGVREKMARAGMWVGAGYAVAGAIALLAVVYALR